ncbi:MAG: hypothetical protein ACT4NY_32785 [Pseudonocardiales bacterium]
MTRIDELAEYYDTHDTSAEMEHGHWETDTVADPMITTSLRMPKSLLDWVRAQAEAAHVKPTALIRRWIEQQRAEETNLDARVSRLEQVVFRPTGS